jgi:hypothetical protein
MQLTRVLRYAADQRVPLTAVARVTLMPSKQLSKLGVDAGIRRKQSLTDEQLQQIEELSDALPVREIAKKVRASKSQVHYYVTWYRDQEVELSTRRTTSAKRCPIHGPLRIWPCVACAAEAARREADKHARPTGWTY